MKTKNFTLAALLLVATLSSCSKDEDQSIQVGNQSPVVLNYKQTANIDAVSTQPISYNSENEFHAKVSSSGEITAQHVGEAKINLTNGSDSKSIQVVVEPKFNLYKTPSIEWGATKSQIKAQYGKPDNETANGVGYSNYSSSAPIVMFVFNSNDRLISSAVVVKTVYASTLADFLIERYMPIDVNTSEYTAMFVNGLSTEKITTAINLSVYNLSYLMVLYVDVRNAAKTKSPETKVSIDTYRGIAEEMLSSLK
ncbi:MAG: hypothetical protein RR388_08915 [Rikenellaceae bacterium]